MSRVAATQQQPSACSIEVTVGDVSFTAREGQRLIELCDLHPTPLHFGCRAGACGTCLVRVVEGMTNLSAITTNEEILLPALTDDPAARLGCQLLVHGSVCLMPMPLY